MPFVLFWQFLLVGTSPDTYYSCVGSTPQIIRSSVNRMDYLRAHAEEYFLDVALDASFGKYGISIADVCFFPLPSCASLSCSCRDPILLVIIWSILSLL